MAAVSRLYENLSEKLQSLGYNHTLPFPAVPLVHQILEDLIQTTTAFRETKQKLEVLKEEEKLWQMGVEPFKCENLRLMKHLNQESIRNLQLKSEYEKKIQGLELQIANLELENSSLLKKVEQNKQKAAPKGPPQALEMRFRRTMGSLRKKTEKQSTVPAASPEAKPTLETQIKQMELKINELNSQLKYQEQMKDSRNEEIVRLQGLLEGGRSLTALARDCCYSEVSLLTNDIKRLQEEKGEMLLLVGDFESKMHEAMQKSIETSKANTILRHETERLQAAALEMEHQSNIKLKRQEKEILHLTAEMHKIVERCEQLSKEVEKQQEYDKGEKENFAARKGQDEAELLAGADLNGGEKENLTMRLQKISQLSMRRKQQNQRLIQHVKEQREKILQLEKQIKENQGICLQVMSNHVELDDPKKTQKQGNDPYNLHSLKSDQKSCSADLSSMQGTNSVLSLRTSELTTYQQLKETVQALKVELKKVYLERDSLRTENKDLNHLLNEKMPPFRRKKEKSSKIFQNDEATLKALEALVSLQKENEELERKLKEMQTDRDNLLRQYRQIKPYVQMTQRNLQFVQKHLELVQKDLKMAEEEVKDLKEGMDAEKMEVRKLNEKIDTLVESYVQLENKKLKLEKKLDELKTKIKKLEEESSSDQVSKDTEAECERLKEKLREYAQEVKKVEEMLLSKGVMGKQLSGEVTDGEDNSQLDTGRSALTAIKLKLTEDLSEPLSANKKVLEQSSKKELLQSKCTDLLIENQHLLNEMNDLKIANRKLETENVLLQHELGKTKKADESEEEKVQSDSLIENEEAPFDARQPEVLAIGMESARETDEEKGSRHTEAKTWTISGSERGSRVVRFKGSGADEEKPKRVGTDGKKVTEEELGKESFRSGTASGAVSRAASINNKGPGCSPGTDEEVKSMQLGNEPEGSKPIAKHGSPAKKTSKSLVKGSLRTVEKDLEKAIKTFPVKVLTGTRKEIDPPSSGETDTEKNEETGTRKKKFKKKQNKPPQTTK